MADPMSKAQMLAEELEAQFARMTMDLRFDAAAELRRLDAVEAERDCFKAHIEAQNKELDALIPMAERLEAERDALRAEVTKLTAALAEQERDAKTGREHDRVMAALCARAEACIDQQKARDAGRGAA